MKKCIALLSVATLIIGMVSCGGNKQVELTKKIPATSVQIMGECSDYFTISDDSVTILLSHVSESEYGWEVRVVIPISKTPNAKTWSELMALPHRKRSGWAGMMGFSGCYPGINLLDVNGTKVDLDLWTNDVNDFLKTENQSSSSIAFIYKYSSESESYEKCKAKYDKISGIKLTFDLSFDEQFANEEPGESEISSNNDWDALLDEYEKYVDKYVSFYKKAMNGDMSAMNEYVALLEKAQHLSEKLEDAQSDMTSAQINRYLKITQKMTNAIVE